MRTHKPHEIVTLVDTFDDEGVANKAMMKAARKLRYLSLTKRYGVYIERHPRFKTWQLFLVDRGNK